MKQPTRWAAEESEATPELRETIRHAQRYTPAPERVAVLAAAVLAELQPTPLTAAPKALGKGAVSVSAAKLVGVCMGAAFGVGMGLSAWHPHTADRSLTAPTAPVELVHAPQELPAPMEAPQPPPVADASAPGVRAQTLAPALAVKRHARTVRPAEDVSLLQGARRERREHPATALRMLEEHARRYPKSALREERDALRIEIMRHIDPSAANALALQFEADFPSSVYGRKAFAE